MLTFALLFSASLSEKARAEDEAPRKDSAGSEITDPVRRVTDRILAYLASQVRSDGSLGSLSSSVAVASLAGTAFLSQGSTPGRGKIRVLR